MTALTLHDDRALPADPTTRDIALRAQAGAANPADIVLPTLLATAASTLCGIAACRAFARCGA